MVKLSQEMIISLEIIEEEFSCSCNAQVSAQDSALNP